MDTDRLLLPGPGRVPDRRRAVHPVARRACRISAAPRPATSAGKIGMVIALAATVAPVAAGVRSERRGDRRADRRRAADRRRDRHPGGPPGRDDPHAGDDRDPAQLRRSGRGAGRVQLLPDRGILQRHRASRRGVPRHVHRRGHLHRLDHRVPEAVREDQVRAADPARPQLAEPRRAGGQRRRCWSGSCAAPSIWPIGSHDGRSRCCSGCTWSRRSAAATCRSWCRC